MTLRFDASAALRHCLTLLPDCEPSIWAQLDTLKRELSASTVPDEYSQPDAPNFYQLPLAQGEAYRVHREQSTLGRVFKVANSLMDQLDAFVIIGQGNGHFGPVAMKDVNTDPYHNEQLRGPRGGKPRMYFVGGSLDTDSLQALLWRLKAGGYSATHREHRFGIVLIDAHDDAATLWPWFHPIYQTLRQSLADDTPSLAEQLVVPILRPGSELATRLESIPCAERFWIPSGLAQGYELLSPVGLLPAAILGHDIMKLLEGAVALNERFQQTTAERDACCQLAALQILQRQMSAGPLLQTFNLWDAALEPLARWNQSLVDRVWSQGRAPQLNCTTLLPRDCERYEQWKPASLVHHLLADKCRTDPIADMISAQQTCMDRELNEPALLSTRTSLSTIDTHELGQWFQMQMIATHLTQLVLNATSEYER